MLIPIGVYVPFDRRPFFNCLVVIVAVVIFGLQIAATIQDQPDYVTQEQPDIVAQEAPGIVEQEESGIVEQDKIDLAVEEHFGPMSGFVLRGFGISGLFGHMWLHGGLMHLIGNMLFLWVFGNAVCSKIGNLMYFPVYITLGLAAAFTYIMFSDFPMIGASGAVNGIVGMYLIFFPINDITCFYWFYFSVGTFSLSSFWMILLWFAFDIFGVVSGGGGVAYTAHVGGFMAGVVIAVTFLKLGIVQMEDDERSLLNVFGMSDGRKRKKQKWQHVASGGPDEDAIRRAVEARQMTDQENGYELNYVPEIEVPPSKPRTVEVPASPSDDGYIRFACQCGKKLKMPSIHAGKKGKCPRCQKRILIPG